MAARTTAFAFPAVFTASDCCACPKDAAAGAAGLLAQVRWAAATADGTPHLDAAAQAAPAATCGRRRRGLAASAAAAQRPLEVPAPAVGRVTEALLGAALLVPSTRGSRRNVTVACPAASSSRCLPCVARPTRCLVEAADAATCSAGLRGDAAFTAPCSLSCLPRTTRR